jgi:hypothetical protein
VLLLRRRLKEATSAFLVLFLVHSVLRTYGLFGSAGYPRYLVCVSPAMALITLAGWNALARRLPRPRLLGVLGASGLLLSALAALLYVDAAEWSRDAWAVDATATRFRQAPRPVTRFYGSQRYMNVVFDDGNLEPRLGWEREHNLHVLREAPVGTRVMWDDERGPHILEGKLLRGSPGPWFDYGYGRLTEHGWAWDGFGGPHPVRMFLLYKER